MKTIQIFIAAAPELESELNSIHDLIQQVNKHFRARGYELQAVDGDSADFVQDLHESDLCLALYCNQFGSFTQDHLEDAYKELCENRNPKKIYIYFKNTDAITEELRIFRDSFSEKYGHFYCRFENVDTMKLNFLLQCEGYINESGRESMLKINNSKVEINGEPFVDLQNLPFAGNNPEYQELLEDISVLQKRIIKYPNDSEMRQELCDMQERREKMENSLLDTAKLIVKLSSSSNSPRLREAMQLFEIGDNKGANAVLNFGDIVHDLKTNSQRFDDAKRMADETSEQIERNLREYELKIKALQKEHASGWVEEVVCVYEEAVLHSRNRMPNERFVQVLRSYADFILEHKPHEKETIQMLCQEALKLYKLLALTNINYQHEVEAIQIILNTNF